MDTRAPIRNLAAAHRLREQATDMQAAIDDKGRIRLENTPKRQRQAAQARNEYRHLLRTRAALEALAAAHEAGDIHPKLINIRRKSEVAEMMKSSIEYKRGYYDGGHDTNQPLHITPQSEILWQMIETAKVFDAKEQTLAERLAKVKFAKIAGYFPTPRGVATRMCELAELDQWQVILEPSAGSGNILDAIKELRPDAELHAYEVNHDLFQILKLKGYDVTHGDFLEHKPDIFFDRILMNPPFEFLQDCIHIMKAYQSLRRGGILVSILSPSGFYNQSRNAEIFRAWLEGLEYETLILPDNSFKESGTSVSTVMLKIKKD